jgi:DNA-binding NarL/FixJ family response regulator
MPNTQVLALSMHDDERYVFDALKAGAAGYVLKRAADADLIEAVLVGEGYNHFEIQETLASPFDLILLDITMPGRSGLDILPDLKIAQPRTPILVVSMHGEEQFALRVLQAGASGFINKSAVADELLSAVEKVLAGRRYVSESLGERLASDFVRGATRSSHEMLSTREFEILRMITAGKSGKEIAAELSLSYKTVSTYRTRILQKLNLRTNHDLRQYALRERLLEDSAL